jgi:hypothetical protein
MADDTVRGCIGPDEYESDWCWKIFVPEPEYWTQEQMARYFKFRGDAYDLPKELVEEYDSAITAREKVDDKLAEIVKTGKGKVQ